MEKKKGKTKRIYKDCIEEDMSMAGLVAEDAELR